ncbi:MAG TPA: hypothetical protein P5096_03780 [Patescibacteria group bacterium]|nr:hypothetical protein [Patescibacteria group bacterium]
MENIKKKTDLIVIIGIALNALALVFVGYIYYTTIPSSKDLKTRPIVSIPQIENPTLESEINALNRPESLPINVDPNELGKSNPYNF